MLRVVCIACLLSIFAATANAQPPATAPDYFPDYRPAHGPTVPDYCAATGKVSSETSDCPGGWTVNSALAEKRVAQIQAPHGAPAGKQAGAGVQPSRNERLAAQEKDDAAAGYKRVSVTDILLDFKTMEAGSKVILTGFHYNLGQLETVTSEPMSTQSIYVVTSGLSRDTRKQILDCHGHSAYCRMTIWAHTGCEITEFGENTGAPCLVVDAITGGTYDSPSTPLLR